MSLFKKFIKDEKAGGAEAVKDLVIFLIITLFLMIIIDCFYVWLCYTYVKTQMDMSNRAVYSQVDQTKLADKQFYIDPVAGQNVFYQKLKSNLKLDNNLVPTTSGLNFASSIQVLDFKIYNQADIPNVTSVGTNITMVSVYSRIQVKVKPIFFGLFGYVTITPYIVTDLPDKALNN